MLYRHGIDALLDQCQTFTLALLTESLCAPRCVGCDCANALVSRASGGVDSAWGSGWFPGQRMKGGDSAYGCRDLPQTNGRNPNLLRISYDYSQTLGGTHPRGTRNTPVSSPQNIPKKAPDSHIAPPTISAAGGRPQATNLTDAPRAAGTGSQDCGNRFTQKIGSGRTMPGAFGLPAQTWRPARIELQVFPLPAQIRNQR